MLQNPASVRLILTFSSAVVGIVAVVFIFRVTLGYTGDKDQASTAVAIAGTAIAMIGTLVGVVAGVNIGAAGKEQSDERAAANEQRAATNEQRADKAEQRAAALTSSIDEAALSRIRDSLPDLFD